MRASSHFGRRYFRQSRFKHCQAVMIITEVHPILCGKLLRLDSFYGAEEFPELFFRETASGTGPGSGRTVLD